MFKSKPISELIFCIFMIIVCFIVSLFLVHLLKYDDSKYEPKSPITKCEGRIIDYDEVKGNLYFYVEGMTDVEFKFDLWSLISKEKFEQGVKNGEIFKIDYSNNTLHKNQYEIITLSSGNVIMVSKESRVKAVTSNLIIYGISLVLACIGLIYFIVMFIKWFR